MGQLITFKNDMANKTTLFIWLVNMAFVSANPTLTTQVENQKY